MDYLGLRTAVNSSLGGREDLPAHIYEVALAEINRDIRILDMQSTTTLTASTEEVSLPSDFLEVVSLYIDSGGSRNNLKPQTPDALNFRRNDTGRPISYAVLDGALKLMPAPDGSYDLELRYYAENAALSADTDVNPVLTKYPEYYLYTVLKHAGAWAQDQEQMQWWGTLGGQARDSLMNTELSRMMSGPFVQRPSANVSRRQ